MKLGGGWERKFQEQLLKSNLDKMSLDAHLGWTEVAVQLGLTAERAGLKWDFVRGGGGWQNRHTRWTPPFISLENPAPPSLNEEQGSVGECQGKRDPNEQGFNKGKKIMFGFCFFYIMSFLFIFFFLSYSLDTFICYTSSPLHLQI